jgi:4-aminobutyrate aminotransferase-like enzyme
MPADHEATSDADIPIADLRGYLIENSWIEPALEQAHGSTVIDEMGKAYIDLEGGPGVTSVGHCHPHVVKAVREQAEKLLIVPGRYQSRPTLNLARRIAKYVGNRLRRTFFVNSGAEAAEGAIKLALKHQAVQGRSGSTVIALQHGYHGRLGLSLALTGIASMKRNMGTFGLGVGVVHAPAPYCFRCPLGLTYPSCRVKCADSLEDLMYTSVHGEVAVMIAEPILGVGGVIVPPDEYWPKAEGIMRERGALLVADEIFTGFGRTGSRFAHHAFGTTPDIVTFGKALGGGVPLSGFIATEAVGAAFRSGDHSTTFGGKNLLGIAAGHAVLDILEQEELERNALVRGSEFIEGLGELARRFPVIGDVRGRGLLIGVEIVSDDRRTPDAARAQRLAAEALAEGLLLATTGAYANVLRVTPALTITSEEVERALAALRSVFERTENGIS